MRCNKCDFLIGVFVMCIAEYQFFSPNSASALNQRTRNPGFWFFAGEWWTILFRLANIFWKQCVTRSMRKTSLPVCLPSNVAVNVLPVLARSHKTGHINPAIFSHAHSCSKDYRCNQSVPISWICCRCWMQHRSSQSTPVSICSARKSILKRGLLAEPPVVKLFSRLRIQHQPATHLQAPSSARCSGQQMFCIVKCSLQDHCTCQAFFSEIIANQNKLGGFPCGINPR